MEEFTKRLARVNRAVDELEKISPDEWYSQLSPRQQAEMDFHNKNRDYALEAETMAQDTYEKFYGNRKYYSTTKRSLDHSYDWIERYSRGKIVLDYACGDGNMALRAARAGAALVVGIDISDISIGNCRAKASQEGLTNVRFVQSNCEATRLPEEGFDAVLCFGMLHHLDLSYAFPELRRLMVVGGRTYAAEALDYNPAIKLYRKLTPQMRTEWEKSHILGLKDLDFARRFFDIGDVNYWHVAGYVGGKVPAILPALNIIDGALERIPLVQLMAWIWTFELIRPEKT
jgi:2-polyprenyl-3-methyl-5-hydroxy-6-metoxy-1,4-benzoquinol methylase